MGKSEEKMTDAIQFQEGKTPSFKKFQPKRCFYAPSIERT